ncbi:MAG: molybdopterin molybdotransferase MoeA [Wenzhouxiangellaceae bacterium]|nr:molybdopterin molybdotransferase MoeA [Wenzhouxiangellaceae bacterium]
MNESAGLSPDPLAADPKSAAGCGHDAPAMSLETARARILEQVRPLSARETVPLRDALHRVLATPVRAGIDVPNYTNSAMDGYAVRAADLDQPDRVLKRIGDSFAGHPFDGTVEAGQCVRIMTGAVLPDGADAVVMQERTEVDGRNIRFTVTTTPGNNVRRAGEDLERGQPVLDAGHWISSADLGVLASVGVAELEVVRKPRVAFYSTGDEIVPVGQPLAAGQIHDSNRHSLFGLLTELGVEVHDLGIVPDQPDAVDQALAHAARFDAVLTTGGVSVGDADYVVDALQRTGSVGFWQVAIKPGRPLAFGKLGDALFFGLPGNPVSAMVTFLQLVRPALVQLAGSRPRLPLRFELETTHALKKKKGRREFQRARMVTIDGELKVEPFGHQGSGVLRSMSAADCFINLAPDCEDLPAGQRVPVEPFAQPVWNAADGDD